MNSKQAQSTLEYTLITILVLAGILVMGPYVIRSINAHFKTLDEDIEYSVAEPIRQGPPTGYQFPECDCPLNFTQTCGNGTNCPVTQEYWYRTCDPFGCEYYFYDVCGVVGPNDPVPADSCWVREACRYNPQSNWPENGGTLKCCTSWLDTGRCGQNANTANGGNIPGGCPDGVMEQWRDCGSAATQREYRCQVDGSGTPVIRDECRFGCGYLLTNTFGDPKDGPLAGGGVTPPPLWFDDNNPTNGVRDPSEPQASWCQPHSTYPNWPDQSGLLSDTNIVYMDPGGAGCTAGARCQALCPLGYRPNVSADACYNPWGPTIALYENPKGCNNVNSLRPVAGGTTCVDDDEAGCGSVGGFFGGGGGPPPPPPVSTCSPAGPLAYCIDPNAPQNHPTYGTLPLMYRVNTGCLNDNGLSSSATCSNHACRESCGPYGSCSPSAWRACNDQVCPWSGGSPTTCSNSSYCYMFPPGASGLPPGVIPVYLQSSGCSLGGEYGWNSTCSTPACTCGGTGPYDPPRASFMYCSGSCACSPELGAPQSCSNALAGYVYPP